MLLGHNMIVESMQTLNGLSIAQRHRTDAADTRFASERACEMNAKGKGGQTEQPSRGL